MDEKVKKTKQIQKKERLMWVCERCPAGFYKRVSLKKHNETNHATETSTKGEVML
jgi:hypothetical protein